MAKRYSLPNTQSVSASVMFFLLFFPDLLDAKSNKCQICFLSIIVVISSRRRGRGMDGSAHDNIFGFVQNSLSGSGSRGGHFAFILCLQKKRIAQSRFLEGVSGQIQRHLGVLAVARQRQPQRHRQSKVCRAERERERKKIISQLW